MIKSKPLLVALLTLMLFGCAGCLGSCFPDSEGGFVDYFTGNSLKRDKALAAEETRRAELRLDEKIEETKQAEALLETQRLKTEEAEAKADLAEWRALEAQYNVEETKVEGTNVVLEAVAFDIKATAVTRSGLQLSAPVLAIVSLLVLALVATWLLTGRGSPIHRKHECRGRIRWE